MAIVTGVRKMRGVVLVSADGFELARIREKDFAVFPVEEGDAIDEEEYLDRLAAKQMKDACNAALTLLEASEKTKSELKKTLVRKGFVEAAAQAAVDMAEEYRFVDDSRFARRAAEIGSRQNVGVYALKRKLRAKGVSEQDAEEALSALDGEQQKQACANAWRKIAYKYEDLPAREGRAKASQALARRGFSWDTISSVLGEAFDEW